MFDATKRDMSKAEVCDHCMWHQRGGVDANSSTEGDCRKPSGWKWCPPTTEACPNFIVKESLKDTEV